MDELTRLARNAVCRIEPVDFTTCREDSAEGLTLWKVELVRDEHECRGPGTDSYYGWRLVHELDSPVLLDIIEDWLWYKGFEIEMCVYLTYVSCLIYNRDFSKIRGARIELEGGNRSEAKAKALFTAVCEIIDE